MSVCRDDRMVPTILIAWGIPYMRILHVVFMLDLSCVGKGKGSFFLLLRCVC